MGGQAGGPGDRDGGQATGDGRATEGELATGGRPRAAPSPAQARLMDHIAAGRRARQRRLFLLICGALSSLVLLLAGSAWGLTSYINAAVDRVNAGTTGGGYEGPLNVLL